MLTVIIPGYSASNRPWVEETVKNLDVDGQIRPIYWDHWENSEKSFVPKEKAHLISGFAPNGTYNIIAKSIGTLVASYVVQKSPESIKKIIFCGICLNDLGEDDKEVIKEALKLLPKEKLLFIQNDEDPHGNITQLKNFLSPISKDFKIISKPAANHDYYYFSEFQGFITGNV